jgi:hypothetical protein
MTIKRQRKITYQRRTKEKDQNAGETDLHRVQLICRECQEDKENDWQTNERVICKSKILTERERDDMSGERRGREGEVADIRMYPVHSMQYLD